VGGDLVSRRGGAAQRLGRDARLAADDEEGGGNAQRREQLAEALHRDLGHGAQRAVVELRRKAVDGGVAAEAVEIDRDGEERVPGVGHGARRDSSSR
jgi:hypothetical protein